MIKIERWMILIALGALAAGTAKAGEQAAGGADRELTSTVFTRTPDLTIPDDSGPVYDTIAVDLQSQVDSIRVYVDVTIGYNSDLTIKLQSPIGTVRYVVFVDSGIPDPDIPGLWFPGDWEPWEDLSAFDGEATAGDWSLICQDHSAGSQGVLNEWRLEIFYEDTAASDTDIGKVKTRYE